MFDYSTINLRELRRLPLYRPRPGHKLSDHLGSGCFGDAPGYPSYFIQSVYNASGNSLKNGPDAVIADPERPGEYRVIDSLQNHSRDHEPEYHQLWNPVSMDSIRFQCWEKRVYQHMQHCYQDPEKLEYGRPTTLIWPPSPFDLPHVQFAENLGLQWGYNIAFIGNEIHPEQVAIEWIPRVVENATGDRKHPKWVATKHAIPADWMLYIRSKEHLAIPSNHLATRSIRSFYPDYQPHIPFILQPPTQAVTSWWERGEQEEKEGNDDE